MDNNSVELLEEHYYEQMFVGYKEFCKENTLYPWEVGLIPTVLNNIEKPSIHITFFSLLNGEIQSEENLDKKDEFTSNRYLN